MSDSGQRLMEPQTIAHTDVVYFLDIAPNKVGGAELFLQPLAKSLHRRGLSVTFVFCAKPSDSVQNILRGPNTQVLEFNAQASFSFSAMRTMYTLLRRIRPRIVIYYLGGIVRPLPWIAKVCGAEQIVYNDHASRVPSDWGDSAWKLSLIRLITRPVTSVVAVSEFVAECNRRERMHRAPVYVVPNAMDLSRRDRSASGDEFLAAYNIPKDRLIISQLSSLIEEKGVDTLLRAAALVLESRRDVQFVIGGEGPGRAEYETLASELGIADHVSFVGKLEDPLLSGFYPASDVFCLPSRWYEAWGLVLMEAMSFGVPVVATRIGGIPEFVRDGVDGILAEGNPAAFAKAISTLLQDEGRRREMGTAAKAWVETEFEVMRIAERYAGVLTGWQSRAKNIAAKAGE